MPSNQKTLQNNMGEMRRRAGLTQKQAAEAADIPLGTLRRWEQGQNDPDMGSLMKLAELYHTTLDSMLVTNRALPANAIPVRPSGTLVPLLGHTHMGEAVDEETCERMVEVPTCVAERHPSGYCVHAEGGCMDNRYTSDSILLVDPDMEPKNDDAVLAELAGYQSVVRVYQRGASTLMLSADSHSGEYEDIIVRADDDPVVIKGVIVWHQAEDDITR